MAQLLLSIIIKSDREKFRIAQIKDFTLYMATITTERQWKLSEDSQKEENCEKKIKPNNNIRFQK